MFQIAMKTKNATPEGDSAVEGVIPSRFQFFCLLCVGGGSESLLVREKSVQDCKSNEVPSV
jgi:hypothetical protein